jgi:hypothetical protein
MRFAGQPEVVKLLDGQQVPDPNGDVFGGHAKHDDPESVAPVGQLPTHIVGSVPIVGYSGLVQPA